ncbi:hypothetical protein VMT65_16300 [Nocardia sp. CDC153]|uniref:hypothetical protein n=1 Tax=Nocardia sp. CDC153 TaxID=3112167 RepID=UPI002DC00BEF|nr:hypothetical protein [Nocardia sp. CDC153]MEC3954602.1 hypothetical protein [Nocardia sp. CDC153]
MNTVETAPTPAAILNSLLRNGIVVRAVALALATIVLIALRHPTWVPYSVSLYAIWNAAALTLNSVRAARV